MNHKPKQTRATDGVSNKKVTARIESGDAWLRDARLDLIPDLKEDYDQEGGRMLDRCNDALPNYTNERSRDVIEGREDGADSCWDLRPEGMFAKNEKGLRTWALGNGSEQQAERQSASNKLNHEVYTPGLRRDVLISLGFLYTESDDERNDAVTRLRKKLRDETKHSSEESMLDVDVVIAKVLDDLDYLQSTGKNHCKSQVDKDMNEMIADSQAYESKMISVLRSGEVETTSFNIDRAASTDVQSAGLQDQTSITYLMGLNDRMSRPLTMTDNGGIESPLIRDKGDEDMSYDTKNLKAILPLVSVQSRLTNIAIAQHLFRNIDLYAHFDAHYQFFLCGNGSFVQNISSLFFDRDTTSKNKWLRKNLSMSLPLDIADMQIDLADIHSENYNHSTRMKGDVHGSSALDISGCFNFIFPPPAEHYSSNVIPGLQMTYSPPRDISFLFTDNVNWMYSRIFDLLFSILQVSHSVKKAHHLLLQQDKGIARNQPSTIDKRCLNFITLAQHFISVINTWSSIICILGPWRAFMEEITILRNRTDLFSQPQCLVEEDFDPDEEPQYFPPSPSLSKEESIDVEEQAIEAYDYLSQIPDIRIHIQTLHTTTLEEIYKNLFLDEIHNEVRLMLDDVSRTILHGMGVITSAINDNKPSSHNSDTEDILSHHPPTEIREATEMLKSGIQQFRKIILSLDEHIETKDSSRSEHVIDNHESTTVEHDDETSAENDEVVSGPQRLVDMLNYNHFFDSS